MHSPRTTHTAMQRQRGAVFIVMLVILIMGVTFFLVSALSKVSLQTARNEKSSDMLAQAKEVVIGYALNNTGGSQYPGELLYPDVLSEATPNYDGNTEGGCLDATKVSSTPIAGLPLKNSTNVMRCVGRLPWKVFSMPIASPSENDPTGFMPWYAISANMVDTGGTPFNSELLNTDNTLHAPNNYPPAPHPWLTVHDMNGNVLSNRVAFIIMIPGAALTGQSRPSSPLAGANQYLDSITVPAACTAPCVPGTYSNADMDDDFIMGDEHRWIDDPTNPGKQIEDPNYNFNDKLIYVTIDELMPLIEKRIAREVKSCLDDYAAVATNTNHKYPWAAPVSDTTAYPNRTGTYNTLFGRVAEIPSNATTSGSPPPTGTLLTMIQAVQTALTNYIANPTAGRLTILKTQGDNLKDYSGSTPQAITAGTTADNCTGMSCTTTLQSQLDTAMGAGTPDATMPSSWTTIASCNKLMLTSSYWADWRDLVFYQIADGFQPGSAGTCVACLSISGSGNTNSGSGTYHASVALAGKMLTGQSPRNATVLPGYLESSNLTNKTNPVPPTVFETYKLTDPSYLNVNDLVMCLDGKNNCQ